MSKMTEFRLARNRYDEQDWNIQYVSAVRNSDAARTAHLRIIAGSALEALDDARDRESIGTAAAIADLPHVAHQSGRQECPYDGRVARYDRHPARHQCGK